MIDTGLKNRVALVTGAQHGIGAAAARALAAEGAEVFIHFFRPARKEDGAKTLEADAVPGRALYETRQLRTADGILRRIREEGGRARAMEADLSDPETVSALFDSAESAFGAIDVLVNNAAHWEADSFLPAESDPVNPYVELWTDRPVRLTAESHDRHFHVNCRAVALMMAEYLRRHLARRAGWGRIVNVSTAGARCFPGEISYGASKAAMEAYSRSAAWELGKFGVTVNVVSPGPTQTGWITPELEKEILRKVPLGRLGQPEDVADVIVFLCSDQARWITGQTINVGGGEGL